MIPPTRVSAHARRARIPIAKLAAASFAAAGALLLTPAAYATTGGPEATPNAADESGVSEALTTVDRDQDLDPVGDEVIVAGAGYVPDTAVRVSLWGMSADTAEELADANADSPGSDGETDSAQTSAADTAANLPGVTDTERHVDVDVSDRGVFSAELDVAADFAEDAGLHPVDDVFEVRVWSLDAPPAIEPGTDPDEAERGVGTVLPARLPVSFAEPHSAAAPPAPAAPSTPGPSEDSPRPPATSSGGETPANAPATPSDASGGQDLSVSKTTDLDPDGETVTVTGSGYDTSKGIYVALCDTAGASSSQAPGPCIGGVDMAGEGGSSAWISSDPPPYGEGLAEPYDGSGTDGGFTVQLQVVASDEFTDCMDSAAECAVVTRNDHMRSSDRSQDVFVPLTFSGQDGSAGADGSGGSGGSGESGSGSGADSAGSSGADSSGSLPRTGAAVAGLAALALAACAAGGATVRLARRRSTPG